MSDNTHSASEEPSNRALLTRIANGDEQAEADLVARFHRGLYFILLKECGNAQLAEDIAQDTFEIVLRKIRTEQLEKPDAIGSFIRQTGIFRLIGHRRKQRRRQTEASTETVGRTSDQNACLYGALSRKQSAALVRQLMEELSVERDRELLKRFYLYDEDKPTICNYLDITPAHFDRVKSRALKRLKKLIQRELGDDEDGSGRQILCLALILVGQAIVLPAPLGVSS